MNPRREEARTMANNRMPGKGGPRGFAGGQKVDGKAFARLMRMLFHD